MSSHRRGNANTCGMSPTGTFARYWSSESLSCKTNRIFCVRSNWSNLLIQFGPSENGLLLSSKKFIPNSVWLDSDRAFKLELSKTLLSSAFTPMDVKLFPFRSICLRFVFLFRACEMSTASSSFNRLWSSSMRRMGGLFSKYSAILTAPKELMLLLLRLI